ncbi:MAG: outer membrane lipoprotein carrier protein LolA [Pseudobdellovibrionaceae bacterium]
MLSKYLKIFFYLLIGVYLMWASSQAKASLTLANQVVRSAFPKAQAKKTDSKSSEGLEILDKTLKKYKRAKSIKLEVKKSLKSELLNKDVVYDGEISMQKDKLRWDTSTPEKSLVLIDGEYVWVVSYPPTDFKSPVQVTKSKISKSNEDRLLLNALLGSKNLYEVYDAKINGQDNGLSTYALEPKAANKSSNVQKLKVVVDSDKSTLTEIRYQDEIGNETKLSFSNLKINPKFKKEHFKFTPPKDAQVTEM